MPEQTFSAPEPGDLGAQAFFIVPCRNEEAHIASVLDSLLGDVACAEAPIVVVDAESDDATLDIVAGYQARHPRIVVLNNPGRLQSIGVNLAVKRFGEGRRYLIRVDAHARYPAGYGSGLIHAAQASGADSVVVPMVAEGQSCFQRAVALAQNSWLSNGGAPHRAGGASGWVDHGHHALMTVAAFRAVGGYDETFLANEDAELDIRLGAVGRRVWLCAEQSIVYHPRKTARTLWRQYFRYGAGRAKTLALHGVRPKLRQWIPICLAPGLLVTLAAPWIPVAAVPLAAWAMLCLCYGGWLSARSGRLCEAASGAAAMIMHLSWSTGYWSQKLGRPGLHVPVR